MGALAVDVPAYEEAWQVECLQMRATSHFSRQASESFLDAFFSDPL